MSDIQTFEWPPELRAVLEELGSIMIRNPHPNREIVFSDLGDPSVVQSEPAR